MIINEHYQYNCAHFTQSNLCSTVMNLDLVSDQNIDFEGIRNDRFFEDLVEIANISRILNVLRKCSDDYSDGKI